MKKNKSQSIDLFRPLFLSGVVKHVGDALFVKSPKDKSDIVCIGFAPWGVIEGRENLIGLNVS